mgnify:CR=1 FL=1
MDIVSKRRNRQRIRVSFALVLAELYEKYYLMMLYRASAMTETNHNDACNLSSMINSIFQKDTSPNDFIHPKDEEINKSIEYYNEYKDLLSKLDKDEIVIIESFMKYLYYNRNYIFLNNVIELESFIYSMKYVRLWICGMATIECVRNNIGNISIFNGKFIRKDSCILRKNLLTLEREYQTFRNKKINRLNKKNKVWEKLK